MSETLTQTIGLTHPVAEATVREVFVRIATAQGYSVSADGKTPKKPGESTLALKDGLVMCFMPVSTNGMCWPGFPFLTCPDVKSPFQHPRRELDNLTAAMQTELVKIPPLPECLGGDTVYCRCGQANLATARFCSECGSALGELRYTLFRFHGELGRRQEFYAVWSGHFASLEEVKTHLKRAHLDAGREYFIGAFMAPPDGMEPIEMYRMEQFYTLDGRRFTKDSHDEGLKTGLFRWDFPPA